MAAQIDEIVLQVTPEAFEYLKIQRGKISELASNFPLWLEAYGRSLGQDFIGMEPYLPARAERIMDIGSGLGGIDVLLARHFRQPEVWLLDGESDSPVVILHAKTFNDMAVARRFLACNGVHSVVTLTPSCDAGPAPCDLIISLQSWCFHYNPEVYLPWVKLCCRKGTTLILDVRRDYKTWRRILRDSFEEVAIIHETAKSERVVFRAP